MKVIYDFMKEDNIVSRLEQECHWGQFTIKGKPLTRTGSFEGIVNENMSVPWLRCPSIENQTIYPMSPIVQAIREKIHNELGGDSNIAKIQKYKDGNIDIKPHTDKIMDLNPGTPIYLIRFGVTRTVILQHKVTKEIRKIDMPHDTLLILDYQDNLEWTHAVAQDASITEPGYSIVFRKSLTFLEPNTGIVYGKHTPFKTIQDIHITDKYYTKEQQTKELVKMYNKENNNVISLDDYSEIMNKAIFP